MWEDRYRSTGEYLFGTDPARFLTENPWLLTQGATALSAGDGEGRNAVHLARAGMQVASFDLAPTAVARAQALAARAGVALETGVCAWQDWDWSRRFDLVIGIFIQFATPACAQHGPRPAPRAGRGQRRRGARPARC